MLEAASRFLRSLLDLRPLVRGGEGVVVEVLTDPESLEDREGELALLVAEDSEGEVATLESPSVTLSGGGPPICLVASGEGVFRGTKGGTCFWTLFCCWCFSVPT